MVKLAVSEYFVTKVSNFWTNFGHLMKNILVATKSSK